MMSESASGRPSELVSRRRMLGGFWGKGSTFEVFKFGVLSFRCTVQNGEFRVLGIYTVCRGSSLERNIPS